MTNKMHKVLIDTSRIKAIIFDFDGVIFNSEPLHWEACNAVFKQIGFTFTYNYYLEKYVGLSDIEMFPRILTEYGYNYHIDEIKRLMDSKIKAYENIIRASSDLMGIQGLPQFLATANKIISSFAICSGSTRSELEITLSKLERGSLKNYFDLIITSEDVREGKPSPEGYLKVAETLGVSPESCLVIEDTKNGIFAARNANMKVIGLTTTHKMETLIDADFIIDGYDQINFISS